MEGHDAIQEGLGIAFDELSDLFFDSTATVVLLKPSTTATRVFDEIVTVTSKRFFHSAKQILYIADSGTNLGTHMASATHVKIGDQYFSIVQDDTKAPDAAGGTRFKWNIKLTKFTESGQYTDVY